MIFFIENLYSKVCILIFASDLRMFSTFFLTFVSYYNLWKIQWRKIQRRNWTGQFFIRKMYFFIDFSSEQKMSVIDYSVILWLKHSFWLLLEQFWGQCLMGLAKEGNSRVRCKNIFGNIKKYKFQTFTFKDHKCQKNKIVIFSHIN